MRSSTGSVTRSRIPGADISTLGYLTIGGVLALWWLIRYLNTALPEDVVVIPEPAAQDLNITARREIIGSYKGNPLYKYVEIEGSRTFTYESLAVEWRPNVYIVDNDEVFYVRVDNDLLYREITHQPTL